MKKLLSKHYRLLQVHMDWLDPYLRKIHAKFYHREVDELRILAPDTSYRCRNPELCRRLLLWLVRTGWGGNR